jgi:4-nitrophenyl phosphatase
MLDWSQIRAVVMDMDGVLWRGSAVLPGAPEWLAHLRTRGIPFALATNNSSKAPSDYVVKLDELGLGAVDPAQIITSGIATRSYLQSRYPSGTPIHVVGGDGLKTLLSDAGYPLADDARVVVVGIDFNLTYARLKQAALLIRAGAEFIGTNADATFPMPDGLAPGAGSLLAALRTATGVEPLVMGKPNPPMFQAALAALGAAPEHTLMIGDRLDTDIQGAHAVGMKTALVLTGVTTAADLDGTASPPDAVYPDLIALRADSLRG